MKNFEKALQCEKEYIKYVRQYHKKPEKSFNDILIQECDYTNSQEYWDEKAYKKLLSKNYEIMHLDCSKENIINYYINAIKNNQNIIGFIDLDELCAWINMDGDSKIEEKLKAHNIKVQYYENKGGCIINGPEDFGIAIVSQTKNVNFNSIANMFIEILRKYNVNAELNGNDIMVDGKKVAGCHCGQHGDTFIFGTIITLSDHLDLIHEICPPHGDKEPGFIDNKELTKEVIEREVLNYFNK